MQQLIWSTEYMSIFFRNETKVQACHQLQVIPTEDLKVQEKPKPRLRVNYIQNQVSQL